MSTFPLALAIALSLAVAQADDAWQPTAGWFTLHHDVMRSGRTEHSPGAPFRYLWHREYWHELIAPEAEPIVAEGLVFVGTLRGTVHALDAETGRPRWTADLASPVHHSPAYCQGKLVVATMSPRGDVVALRAGDGKPLWRFTPQRSGGFAASPAIWRGHVYLGDRAGDFYAIDLATGRMTWRQPLGAPVLQSAAVRDGCVAIAAEDLVPRLLDAADGKPRWIGAQMAGSTLRGYYPVFWGEQVVWRTDTSALDVYHDNIQQATDEGRLYADTRRRHGWGRQAEDILKTLPGRYTEAKYRREQEYVAGQMRSGKHPRSFYALRASDGKEPMLYAVGYHGSENGYSTPAPGPVGPDGALYVFLKSVYSEWQYPIRAFDALGVLDQGDAVARLVRGIDRTAGSFPATCDESNNLTLAGDKLFDTHDHVLAYMDLSTRKVYNAFSARAPELWGGVFKAYAPDRVAPENPGVWKLRDTENSLHLSIQWNGPALGAAAIYRDKVWWITGSMIVCLQGKVN